MIIKGKYQSEDILPLVTEMFEFISGYDGNIPGASAKDCGNYLDMNLGMAKYWAYRYLQILSNITIQNLRYPD